MSAKLTSQEARAILDPAVVQVFGEGVVSPRGVDLIQGLNRYETGYGAKWNGVDCPGADTSNNWGGVKTGGAKWATANEAKCTPGKSFACQDRDAAGNRWWYCFRIYATPQEGAADVVRILFKNQYTRAYLQGGGDDPAEFAAAMRRGGYFEEGLSVYAKNLADNVAIVRKDLGHDRSKGPMVLLVAATAGVLLGGVWATR